MPSRLDRRQATLVGAALILVTQAIVRTAQGRKGFFSLDDFVFYTRATHSRLLDPDFLMEAYNGHLMPGAFAWVWVSSHFAPLDFAATFATMMVVQFLVGIAVFALLAYLFGLRPAILVPFAVACLTLFTLPSSWWWAAAINQQPQQLSAALFLLAHFAFVRTGHRRWVVAAAAALMLGLAFFEKSALAVPFAGLLTWAYYSPVTNGARRTAIRSSLRVALVRYRAAWLGYLVVLIPYSAYYAMHARQEDRGWPESSAFLEMFDFSIRKSVIPAIVGGPWHWSPTGVVDSNADPSVYMQAVAAALVCLVVWASLKVNRQAGRAWGVAAGYFLVLVCVLTVTRGAVIGSEVIGTEYRYISDFALVLALCGAFAFLPARFGPWWSDRPVATFELPPEIRGLPTAAVATTAVIVLMVSSAYSTSTFAERWTQNPARTWVENASAAIPDLGPEDRYYDGVVPTAVVWQLLSPANLPSNILGPLGLKAQPLEPGEYRDELWHFAADGRLESSNVSGVTTSRFDEPDCLVRVGEDPETIPLQSKVFEWPWILQLEYTTPADGHLRIEAGETDLTVEVHSTNQSAATFLPTIYTPVSGGYDELTLSSPDTTVCVKTLKIGAPQPNEW